ncbi:hypothetical protein NC651_006133 [Populus alba x Populus x berolinensis]|nr:hypothetical protein NC651_006133 [Populus alba x Populus x berolinensis]
MSPAKKRKVTSFQHDITSELGKLGMSRYLKSALGEMHDIMPKPGKMVENLSFCWEKCMGHCLSGRDSGEEEIDIDIDELNDDTLFTL